MLCYTSGTTGNPKGVLYEHRSSVIHAMAEVAPACFDLSPASVALPIVPMFHAAAWGLPFAGAMAGIKFVYAAGQRSGRALPADERGEGDPQRRRADRLARHVPAYGRDRRERPSICEIVTIGGSAAPRAMIERLMKMGIRVGHAWGMTETSPIGTIGSPPANWDELSFEEQVDLVAKQGRVPFGVELRVVDDEGEVQPRDGESSGRLQIRGPWVIRRYFQDESGDCAGEDNWFDTGDVAVIHPCGTMQITDRSKDVIKSGGEWISSVDLENAAVGCAGVAEAAAIGIQHPKWDERPLLLVVRKPGSEVSAEIRAHLANHVAKWWLPDEILFVDSLPHTATGKLLKTALREQYRDYQLATACPAPASWPPIFTSRRYARAHEFRWARSCGASRPDAARRRCPARGRARAPPSVRVLVRPLAAVDRRLAAEWTALADIAAEPNAFAEHWFVAASLPHPRRGPRHPPARGAPRRAG